MAILFGIDGTGPTSNAEYQDAFKRSFVKQMCTNGNYIRGPIGSGGGTATAVNAGYNYIKGKIRAGDRSPILLTGYSRGAFGALLIAKKLKADNITVTAALMFDCVDRYLFGDTEYVPNNVLNVFHIRRSPAAQSRKSFSNDGTKFTSPTKYKEKFFFGTHGAMGGTYWKPEKNQRDNEFVDEGAGEAFLSTPATPLNTMIPLVGLVDMYKYKTKVTFGQDRAASTAIATDSEVGAFIRSFGFPAISPP